MQFSSASNNIIYYGRDLPPGVANKVFLETVYVRTRSTNKLAENNQRDHFNQTPHKRTFSSLYQPENIWRCGRDISPYSPPYSWMAEGKCSRPLDAASGEQRRSPLLLAVSPCGSRSDVREKHTGLSLRPFSRLLHSPPKIHNVSRPFPFLGHPMSSSHSFLNKVSFLPKDCLLPADAGPPEVRRRDGNCWHV